MTGQPQDAVGYGVHGAVRPDTRMHEEPTEPDESRRYDPVDLPDPRR